MICDNNFLAASMGHFKRVIDRFVKWGWADFNQSIDSRLLALDHVKRIAEIKKLMVRLVLDNMGYDDDWEKAFLILRKTGLPKTAIRSYTLIGFTTRP